MSNIEEKYYKVTEEILEDFFNAGYDYRSSKNVETIAEYGENSILNFKEKLTEWL